MSIGNKSIPHSDLKRIMEVCLLYAKKSPDKRLQVGAVITDADLNILSIGWNSRPECDIHFNDCVDPKTGSSDTALLHAEERAIVRANYSDTIKSGSKMFVTTCPCKRCASRIIEAGIKTVFFILEHDQGEGANYLSENGVNVVRLDNVRRKFDEMNRNIELLDFLEEDDIDFD